MAGDEKIEQKKTDPHAKLRHYFGTLAGHIGGVLAVISTFWGPGFFYAAVFPPLPVGMTDPIGVILSVFAGTVMTAYAITYWIWFWRK